MLIIRIQFDLQTICAHTKNVSPESVTHYTNWKRPQKYDVQTIAFYQLQSTKSLISNHEKQFGRSRVAIDWIANENEIENETKRKMEMLKLIWVLCSCDTSSITEQCQRK